MSPCVIWPEVVVYQNSFTVTSNELSTRTALYNLSVSPKGFKGDKLARLRGVLGSMNTKELSGISGVNDVLEEELLNFGHSPHDDAVDSMVLTMGGLLRRGALQIDYNSDSFQL